VTPEGDVVLISEHGDRWDLPAGRPEAGEDWEQTLRREMLEEACAVVRTARLLGFIRGRCIRGHEEGLVLVRAIWRADVDLRPWDPQFEIPERRVVPVAELLSYLAAEREGFLPVWRRALVEAGLV
jgi:ADP-ribose pyrophosphatase YjhB (NUDIX family)